MASLLPFDVISALIARTIDDGLADRRATLMAAFDPAFVAGLTTANTPREQLGLDLHAMNRIPLIVGDVTPLVVWLLNAKFLNAAFPDRQRYYGELADRAQQAAGVAATAPGDAPAAIDIDSLPERILFHNDLVPAAFITGAVRTAGSIARVTVPQIAGGTPRLNASSGAPVVGYGTGWLIGAGFLITNWHVVQARAANEAVSEADIKLQCAAASAEFDYDDFGAATTMVKSAGLAIGDAKLDYAILRLATPAGRAALPLRTEALTFDPVEPFAVNVIQHPGGAPKQYGIRNNLLAAVETDDLAYYTDTAGGSSGSPVCDDRWQVIALHKASTRKFGTLKFQGSDTPWINIGTPIGRIADDIRTRDAALWQEIAAVSA